MQSSAGKRREGPGRAGEGSAGLSWRGQIRECRTGQGRGRGGGVGQGKKGQGRAGQDRAWMKRAVKCCGRFGWVGIGSGR